MVVFPDARRRTGEALLAVLRTARADTAKVLKLKLMVCVPENTTSGEHIQILATYLYPFHLPS